MVIIVVLNFKRGILIDLGSTIYVSNVGEDLKY
jgi:hypothetical protein